MFRVDWPVEFAPVSELPVLPVTSTSLLTLSFNLEVSPVSWKMRPSSARRLKLPLWPCRQPRMPFCAFDELTAPLCGSAPVLLCVLLWPLCDELFWPLTSLEVEAPELGGTELLLLCAPVEPVADELCELLISLELLEVVGGKELPVLLELEAGGWLLCGKVLCEEPLCEEPVPFELLVPVVSLLEPAVEPAAEPVVEPVVA